jgi:ribonuclease J
MSRTSITFYGGVNEIGGNKILVEDGDTRIFLDFGMSFSSRKQYYSPPLLVPRSERGLMEFKIIPDLKGLYRFDRTKPEIDAVFISHSHMDHSAYVSFLKSEIPVYCGETTGTILDALSTTRLRGFEFNIDHVQFKTFRTGDKAKIGSLEIDPVHVDHSVPGSYGFIIHTSSGAIVYTGDFRRHGLRPDLSEDFIQKAKESEPSALITEGTNLTSVNVSSEKEVERKIDTITGQTGGLLLANFASGDVDRLWSFYRAAVGNDRYLAITMRQAYLLFNLRKDPNLSIPDLSDRNILIFQRTKSRYRAWEKQMMELGRTTDSSSISKMQSKIVLVTSFYDIGELINIEPDPGSCYVLSASDHFDEEMVIDFEKLLNWLDHYGLPQYHAHASGHVAPFELRNALEIIEPKEIFPIHTNRPELLGKYIRDLESDIQIPEKGKKYLI